MKLKTVYRISYFTIIGIIVALGVFFCCFNNRVISGAIPLVSKLQRYGSLVLLATTVVFTFLFKGKLKKTTLLVLLFTACIMFSSLRYDGYMKGAILQYTPFLLICTSLDMTSVNEKMFMSFLNALKYLLLAVVLVDILTQIMYPNGMYSTELYDINWFLGYKTERTVYSLPMVMLFTYTSFRKKGSMDITSYAVLIIALVNGILSQGTGCSVIFLILGALALFVNSSGRKPSRLYKCLTKLMDCRLIMSIYIIAVIMVAVVENSQLMAYVAGAFGKTSDFSGRTTIWKACLSLFKTSPIFGRGYLTSSQYAVLAGFDQATNAHNAVISILVNGGIVAAALYLIIYFCTLMRKRKYTKCEMTITLFVYVILLLGITSSIFIYSSFSFVAFWFMENEKDKGVKVDVRMLQLGSIRKKRRFRKIKFVS